MISFAPTEEQEVARDALRDYAAEAMRPRARDAEETCTIPDGFFQESWELGLTSTQIPEEYGGAGEDRSPLTNVLVLEELAHGDVALALAAVAPSLFALPLVDQGTEDQKQRYLPAFCGERYHTGSLAVCEPSPLFDPLALATTAEAKGDGYLLSGRKCFVPLGDQASHFLVLARNTGSREEGFAAIDGFIVARDAKGLAISETEKNLGLRALPTSSLELERVEVAEEDRLGGDDFDARQLFNSSRVGLAAVLVGLSRAVMEYAIPYAKERVAFDQAIAQKQAIAFMLSDMAVETDASRWLLWRAAAQLEQGLDATRSAHMAVDYAVEQAMKIADNGVQVLGGHGFIREHPVELWYRNARTLGVLEGCVTV